MYVSLSTMTPNPGHEQDTAGSMQRFAAAARGQEGLVLCSTFKDMDTSELVGIAVWESEAAATAAGPALMAAVENDDFDAWVATMTNRRLHEV